MTHVIRFPGWASEYRVCFNKPKPKDKGEVVSLGIHRSIKAKQEARRRARQRERRLRLVESPRNGP